MSEQANPPTFNTFTIVLIWIALLAAGSFFFDDLLEGINNPNRTVTVNITQDGSPEVILKQNRQGHYIATGKINGQPVRFLLDTGATNVAIPQHIAKQLQLEKGPAHQTMTANGTSTSYATRLETASIGPITLTNVSASISTGMKFDEILLGMSFLRHLKMTQQGKQLTLSVPDSSF